MWILLQGLASDSTTPGAIGIRDNVFTHTIYRVYRNSPAEKTGIKLGDKIVRVQDDTGSREILGKAGSWVNIWVKRGPAVLMFRVQRAPEYSIERKVDKVHGESPVELKPSPSLISQSSPSQGVTSETTELPQY